MKKPTKKAVMASIDALMRVPGTKLQTILPSLIMMESYVYIHYEEFMPLMEDIIERAWEGTPEEERYFIGMEDDFPF